MHLSCMVLFNLKPTLSFAENTNKYLTTVNIKLLQSYNYKGNNLIFLQRKGQTAPHLGLDTDFIVEKMYHLAP